MTYFRRRGFDNVTNIGNIASSAIFSRMNQCALGFDLYTTLTQVGSACLPAKGFEILVRLPMRYITRLCVLKKSISVKFDYGTS